MEANNNNILKIDNSHKGILQLILDDQKNKNSLSEAMINHLKDAFEEASNDHSIKVIIISAIGDVFCSGHNLKEITHARGNEDEGESYYMNLFNLCSTLMQLIINCSKPVIAEIDGIATAAGCQLVASCDLAVASDSSKFATPGVNIGLFCSTPMVALSRNVKKKDAMKMLLTGDMIDAQEAKRISLINDCISKNELKNYVIDLAEKIAGKATMTVKNGKAAFYKQSEMSLSDAYDYTSKIMKDSALKEDAKEGIAAFLDKRKPNWKGGEDE